MKFVTANGESDVVNPVTTEQATDGVFLRVGGLAVGKFDDGESSLHIDKAALTEKGVALIVQ